MASYDRRILVPYLQDVCSTELLCARLEKEVNQCTRDVGTQRSEANQKIVDPPVPQEEEFLVTDLESDRTAAIIYGIIAFVGLLIGWNFLGIGLMLFGGFFVVIFIWNIVGNYQDRHARYLKAIENHKKQVEINQRLRSQIPQRQLSLRNSQQQLSTAQTRLRDAQRLRNEVYSVNVIPAKYRNIYAAYYLYDYFSTSRETDLDKIIQTLLLDEIKQRLDKIIIQNEQIVLNQRYQIALQEQQNRITAENHRDELRQIARLEKNQERQMDYQNMIARNQQVTNFILAADYMRKYR